MTSRKNCAQQQSGLSYVEVLVALILIGATVVPATDALRNAMQTADADSVATINHYRLLSKMEEVVAVPFSTLSAQAAGVATATVYSDASGTSDRRVVFVSTYDADNADTDNNPFTGTEADLLWVRVEIEGSVAAVETLKAR